MNFQIEAKEYGKYDVLVCGAGTAGVFAAIAAARQGAKTLLIERSFAVGGMLTIGDGGITKFTEHCKDVDVYKKEVLDVLATEPRKVQVVGGIPLEYVERMIKAGTAMGTSGTAGSYVFTDKCEAQAVLMDMLEEAGVEVLYDTRVCMVQKEGDSITGVVVCNKDGFSSILASRVIDTTGDADVAAWAGVPYNKGANEADVEEGAATKVGQMMHFGTMYRVRNLDFDTLFAYLEEHPEYYHQHEFGVMSLENAKESYKNGEMFVFRVLIDVPGNGLRPVQVYNLPTEGEAILLGPYCGVSNLDGLVASDISKGQKAIYDGVRKLNGILKNVPGFENIKTIFIPDVGIRETRHIIGEYVLNGIDVMSGRDFEDSIACGGHPLDIQPIPPELEDVDLNHWRFHIPYRTMVPLKVENLLVAGRSISATRIASGAIRPTAQCMAMGEAAGVAAALSIKENVSPRNLDIQNLRNVLLENGVIL